MSEKVKNKGRLGTLVSFLCFAVIGLGCGIAVIPVIDYFMGKDSNFFILNFPSSLMKVNEATL